jgi:hypothetical protein
MPIIIRNSERVTFKRCQARWVWSFVDGLVPNVTDTKLWFGGGIHIALAEWYQKGLQRGPHPAKTWAKFVADEEVYIKSSNGLLDEVKWLDSRDLGMQMLLNYTDTYGDDPTWDVIATEQTFQVKSRLPDGTVFYITGTFDGVYRDTVTKQLWLMEHKTSAGIPDTGFLDMSDQGSTYFAVAEIVLRNMGIMGKYQHLEGIMYNFLRKAMPDDRPKNEQGKALNKNGSVSKVQPSPLFMRYEAWRSKGHRIKTIEHMKDEVAQMMAIRNGQFNPTKTPTMDCRWDCAFYQMCQLHESGDDWEDFRDAMFTKQDPYADHRAAMKDASV